MPTHNLDLDPHRYVWVHPHFISTKHAPYDAPVRAVWWGVSLTGGRTLGCHVLLENRAMVIDLPLNALQAVSYHLPSVSAREVAQWDCFSDSGEVYQPAYLVGARVYLLDAKHRLAGTTPQGMGRLLFAIDFDENGYSRYPEQHKLLWVVAREDGRFVWLPQDQVLVEEPSFTDGPLVAPPIRRQTLIHRAEGFTLPLEEG